MSKKYAIYEADTGKIILIYSGQIENMLMNVPDGCKYIEADEVEIDRSIVRNGEIVSVEVESDISLLLDKLRRERNRILAACDWTQTMDAPVDRVAWAAYRQALRDLPANTVDPRAPQWPSPPA
jgi:hypothetical protein